MRRFEARAYRPFERVVLVTDEDAREVARLDPSLRTATIPNGVDAAYFAPPGRRRARSGDPLHGRARRAVQRAGRRCGWPSGSCRSCGAPCPTRRCRSWVAPPVPRLRALDGVRVVADVPDLRPYLWGAAVYACPMESGTGIKNKLLEAMAAGAPAVATPLACQGLAVRDGEQLRIADADADVRRGARRRAARSRPGWRDAARAYVTAHHDWDAVAAAYSAVYEPPSLPEPELDLGATSAPAIVSGGLWTLLSRVLPQAQLLVLSIVVARYLGPDEMGRQSYIAFVALTLVQAATAGLPGRVSAASSASCSARAGAGRRCRSTG